MKGEQSQALPVFLPPCLVLKGAVWPGIEWGPRRIRFVAEACEGTGLLSWNIHVQWGVGRLLSTKTWVIFWGFICWGRLTNNQIWRLQNSVYRLRPSDLHICRWAFHKSSGTCLGIPELLYGPKYPKSHRIACRIKNFGLRESVFLSN